MMDSKNISQSNAAAVGFIFSAALCGGAYAQSTLVLSNLEEPSSLSKVVASDSWISSSFRTGDNPEGYFLDSVHLAMEEASGFPEGFSLSIYRLIDSGIGFDIGDATKIADINGLDPSRKGVFSFDSSGAVLAPSTVYGVVASATTDSTIGAYSWSVSSTSNYDSERGWDIGAINWQSSDGISWDVGTRSRMQYAINATAIPEPSTITLLGLGGLLAASRFRRRAKVSQSE